MRVYTFYRLRPTRELHRVYMRCTYAGGHRCEFATPDIYVDVAKWSGQRCLHNTYHGGLFAADINRALDLYDRAATMAGADYSEKAPPPPAVFREALQTHFASLTGQTGITIRQAFDMFISDGERQRGWAFNTCRKWLAVAASFCDYAGAATPLDKLTIQTTKDYIAACTADGKKNTTTAKMASLLRWWLKWCAQSGIYTGDVHMRLHPRLKGADGALKPVIYCTLQELAALEGTPHTDIERGILDIFLFCAFSGLRHSDAVGLRWPNIHGDALHIVQRKTGRPVSIELNDHTRAILERRTDAPTPLPQISSQVCNRHLPQLAQLAEICEPVTNVWFVGGERFERTRPKYELITTHAGRRSFCVNALTLGIPLEVVMRWTGHSTVAAMRPYVDISEQLRRTSMQAFNVANVSPQKSCKDTAFAK